MHQGMYSIFIRSKILRGKITPSLDRNETNIAQEPRPAPQMVTNTEVTHWGILKTKPPKTEISEDDVMKEA
jgi:hypothetical protein